MRWPLMRGLTLLIPAVLALSACGGGSTAPTEPTAPTLTETFSGSVDAFTNVSQTTGMHPFAVQKDGFLQITLVTVGPLNTLAVGLGVGAWNGTTCTPVLSTGAQIPDARQGSVLSGGVTAANFCALIYNSGNIGQDVVVTYTIQVDHT